MTSEGDKRLTIVSGEGKGCSCLLVLDCQREEGVTCTREPSGAAAVRVIGILKLLRRLISCSFETAEVRSCEIKV